MTVMVQCFSGGFSHLIFEENNQKKERAKRNICGFFATVCDREAAGCTPDVNEANYDEFSSHFWAALRGRTRTEKEIADCDYDGDGRVSFEEAHAYAILTSRNIDIPVKTSGAFLRIHSRLHSDKEEDRELLGRESSYAEILEQAGTVDREVLEGLSTRLALDGEQRGALAGEKASEIGKKMRKIEEDKKAHKKKLDGARMAISRTIRNRWPDLENRHSPGAVNLLSNGKLRAEFVAAVEKHPRYSEWDRLKQERGKLEGRELELSREYANWRRFVRVFENVAYGVNLEQVADEDVVQAFQRLMEAEREGLSGKLGG